MFISTEKEQISFPLESLTLSSPVGSTLDSLDGLPQASELSESPPLPSIYTDVNVVPEHEKNELEQSIVNLEGEIEQLKLKLSLLKEKRGEALNKILDIKGNIRVFARVLPFLSSDKRRNCISISLESEKVIVKAGGLTREFEFDKVFSQESSQGDIFIEVEPIVKSAIDGHNVCILAYGQTGTGKTYTMDGKAENPGIVPCVLEKLFSSISYGSSSSITFSISMLEVYLGNVKDLLAPKPSSKAYEPARRCNLNIQTDPKGFVEIEGLSEIPIRDFLKAKWWYSKGRRARSTSWTNVNESSSRSHCLTKITIYRHGDSSEAKVKVSKLWMVDLGGSERLLKTGATGLALDEGRAINLSLSALGDVVAALRRKRGHVPYRNSKLTQILRDSLGDSSKVLMLVHLSPYEEDVGETICSLTFAKRARAIESGRELPEDLRKQRERRIAEIEQDMKDSEDNCREITTQMQSIKFRLDENKRLKRLFSATHHRVEVPDKDLKEAIIETARKSEKACKLKNSNSLPHFMTSTQASRQRENTAEREIIITRGSKIWSRSSFQLVSSQSISSYSDQRSKAKLPRLIQKSRYAETNNLLESPKHSSGRDSKVASMLQSKTVGASDPNFRAPHSRHRRRMSDFN